MPTPRTLAARVASPVLVACLAAACGGSGPDSGPDPGTLVADFLLPDVNPNSATFATDVSPRDHLGSVSVWYFGHAT
jgi:hypothetical protein